MNLIYNEKNDSSQQLVITKFDFTLILRVFLQENPYFCYFRYL